MASPAALLLWAGGNGRESVTPWFEPRARVSEILAGASEILAECLEPRFRFLCRQPRDECRKVGALGSFFLCLTIPAVATALDDSPETLDLENR
jgi:hypothetical protein